MTYLLGGSQGKRCEDDLRGPGQGRAGQEGWSKALPSVEDEKATLRLEFSSPLCLPALHSFAALYSSVGLF